MFVLGWIGRWTSQETLRPHKASRRESMVSVPWQTSLNRISFHVNGSIRGNVLKKLSSCEKVLECIIYPGYLLQISDGDSTNNHWKMDPLLFCKALNTVWKEETGKFESLGTYHL